MKLTISHPSLRTILDPLTKASHSYSIVGQLTDLEPILLADSVPNDVVPVDINLQNKINLVKNDDVLEKLVLDKEPDIIPEERIDIPDRAQIDDMNVCMSCARASNEKYIVLPCGHGWLCGVCVRQFIQEIPICPKCHIGNVVYQLINFF